LDGSFSTSFRKGPGWTGTASSGIIQLNSFGGDWKLKRA
jgi:hypothetical protein